MFPGVPMEMILIMHTAHLFLRYTYGHKNINTDTDTDNTM